MLHGMKLGELFYLNGAFFTFAANHRCEYSHPKAGDEEDAVHICKGCYFGVFKIHLLCRCKEFLGSQWVFIR